MKTSLEIQNLKCGGCASTIINRLSHLASIHNIKIDNDQNIISFSHESKSNLEEVKALLLKLGYPVVGEKNAVSTKAKSFVSCAIGRINS